ncbi:MAG: ATP-binding protein, partial [Novosphingobium sp.]
MASADRLRWLVRMSPKERRAAIATLSPIERQELRTHWRLFARSEQLPPPGDWRIWLIMAGRGFGKSRAGAEWVRAVAKRHPDARIALVGASLGEARAVMVEGE